MPIQNHCMEVLFVKAMFTASLGPMWSDVFYKQAALDKGLLKHLLEWAT